jgi:hypothetical protein
MAGDWFDEQQGGFVGGGGATTDQGFDEMGRRKPAVNAFYQQYWGRPAADWEQSYWADQGDLSLGQIQQTLQQAPEAQQAQASGAVKGSDKQRIDQMLQAVQSTDDPSYWYQVAAQHGGLDATGVDWMNDRIRRGDGSALVKSGQLSKFVDTSSPNLNMPAFQAPTWDEQFTGPKFTETFKAPDAAALQQEPGYQARLDAGQRALERSAAAKGTLLTGGTQQDLNQYAQDYASNEYGNAYNRALTGFQTDYNTFQGDYARQLGEYQQRYGQYSDAYNRALQQYGQQYGMASDAYNRAQQAYQFQTGLQQQDWQNQQAAQQADFNRKYSLANLGYNAAAGAGNAGAGLGDYYTQIGNANAAAQVGSGNAWNTALGQAGQLPLAAYLTASSYNRQQPGPYATGYRF